MKRITLRAALLVMCGAMIPPMLVADELDDIQTQRNRLDAERSQVEARWRQADQACQQRFAVTDCREREEAKRQKALRALRDQEVQLNNAERRVRGQMAKDRLQQRDREQAERLQSTRVQTEAAARDQGDAVTPTEEAAPKGQGERVPKTASAPSPAQQAQNASKHAERLQEAEQHRKDVQKRHEGQTSTALPLPKPAEFPK